MLQKTKGYILGPETAKVSNVTNNFFVDDLTIYAKIVTKAGKQLELITALSADIGMRFDQKKMLLFNC